MQLTKVFYKTGVLKYLAKLLKLGVFLLILPNSQGYSGKTYPSNRIQALMKSLNMDIWIIGTLNQIFIRSSYAKIKFSKK